MAKTTNDCITASVDTTNRELLEQALSLSGFSSLNSFVVHAAIAEAKRLIEQNHRIALCSMEALAFVEALDKPAQMNDKFLKAARMHKETITNENRTTR